MVAKRNSRGKHSVITLNLFESIKAAAAPGRLCLALLGVWAVSAASQASTLSINNNVITLDGELSATVTHTAQGMAIDIPGVEITLDCPTTDACTVSIGSSANAGGYGSGATNTAGSNWTNDWRYAGGSSNTGTPEAPLVGPPAIRVRLQPTRPGPRPLLAQGMERSISMSSVHPRVRLT